MGSSRHRFDQAARLNWANVLARRTSAQKVVMNHWADLTPVWRHAGPRSSPWWWPDDPDRAWRIRWGSGGPGELWGRCSLSSVRQAGNCRWARSSDTNCWAFKHSSRSFPLNDSICELSVGLPGRVKSSATPRYNAHASSAFEMNSVS